MYKAFVMEKNNELMETVKTVVYAVVIAVLIRTFLFEPFKIPSGSMYPTLYVGDYLFVSKYTYGYSKHSLPFSIPLFKGKIWADNPEIGDIVVFKNPQDNRAFIKRVVAVEGDKIRLIKGRLFINDELVEREEVENFVTRNDYGIAERFNQYIETLPSGIQHKIIERSDNESLDNYHEVTVPEGAFFAMGDNRDHSDDSRASVGFIPYENIVGKARILFFSHDKEGAWYKPWTWPKKIRWNRMFDRIK